MTSSDTTTSDSGNPTETPDIAQLWRFAHQMADIAGQYIRRGHTTTDIKTDGSPVTDLDRDINRFLIKRTKRRWSDHGVIAEEQSWHPDRHHIWLCDPVDGTLPHTLGLTASTFTLAHLTNGTFDLGLIDDPHNQRRIHTTPDSHTLCNRHIASTSTQTKLDGAKVGFEVFPNQNPIPDQLHTRLCNTGAFPVTYAAGSHTALQVALGNLDALISTASSPWDLATPAHAIKGAGGHVSDLHGQPHHNWTQPQNGLIAAATPQLHQQLLQMCTTS